MKYTIKLKLSFCELLALDTALQNERKRLMRDIHNYATYEDILVDDTVTGGGSHE